MIKILEWIIEKLEIKLSKKYECYFKKETTNEKIKLYRTILDSIDDYNYKINSIVTIRHYRYFNLTVDDIDKI